LDQENNTVDIEDWSNHVPFIGGALVPPEV